MSDSDSDRRDPSAALLDLRATAEYLGVHYMTAYRYVRLGRLPAERHDGRWWIPTADAERFAAERENGQRSATNIWRRWSPCGWSPG